MIVKLACCGDGPCFCVSKQCGGELLLGTLVRKRRRAEGLTLQQLVEAVGTSKGYIHDIESGRASNPSFDFTIRLFGLLNLSADAVWRRMA